MATALPAAGYFSDVLRVNSEAKTAQDNILAYLRQSGVGNAGATTTLTLATDTITPTGALHLVDTESAAATDNLSTIAITNTVDGQLLILSGVSSARIITVKHAIGGTGQILLQNGLEYALEDYNHLILRRSGNNWIEVMRNSVPQVFWCGTAGGTANALTASPNQIIPALRTGMQFNVIAGSASTSTTVTFNVQSFGTKSVKKISGTGKVALGQTDIIAGLPMQLVYDGTDMVWVNAPNDSHAVDVASAGTLVLNSATGNYVFITGTTNITAITLAEGQRRILKFGGILTFTNGASLVITGGANITTAAGDTCEVVGEASGVVRVLWYTKASGKSVIASAESEITFTDITTNNSSTSNHGFLKKLSNNSYEFMDGTGAWSIPSQIPQNSKSAAYTTVLSDAGKHIFHPSADTTARTWTIDSNANVAYPVGTVITFINQNAGGVITIAITSDTMRLASSGTTGNRSLAANGIATAIKLATTEWLISGVGLT